MGDNLLKAEAEIFDVTYKIPNISHPVVGWCEHIQIVNLLRSFHRNPLRFQYRFPKQEIEYNTMNQDINTYYKWFSEVGKSAWSRKEFLEFLKVGNAVVVQIGKIYRRAILTSTVKIGKNEVFVKLVDKNAEILSVPENNIYPLIQKFSILQPWVRFFTLHGLSLYEDVSYLSKILQRAPEDFFGSTGLQYVKFMGISAERPDEAVVLIEGNHYPKDKYPLGLNGFLVEQTVEKMQEPRLPHATFHRSDVFIIGGRNNGDLYIGAYNPAYEHLQRILQDLNNSENFSLLDNFKTLETSKLTKDEIYLAPYSADQCYYRAKYMPRDADKYHPLIVNVYFMDYGVTELVHATSLVLAKDINYFLAVISAQALKVHLTGVDSMNSEKLSEIVDIDSESFILQTLQLESSENPNEVVLRRLTPRDGFNNLNEELVEKIGNGKVDTCKEKISKLNKVYQLPAATIEQIWQRSILDTHFIVWSGINEPLEILKHNQEFEVQIVTADIPGCIVMVPPRRLDLLDALEKEMYEAQMRFKQTRKGAHCVFQVAMNPFMGIWLPNEKRVIRVKLLETWKSLIVKQGGTHFKCKVYLIDYGTKSEAFVHELVILDEMHCRYSPFAMPATIKTSSNMAVNFNDIHPKILSSIFKGALYKATILSIKYDGFDVPRAVVKFKFQTEWFSQA